MIELLDAKASLSRLVLDIESGEGSEFIIARAGRPAARLVRKTPTGKAVVQWLRGQVLVGANL